MLQSQGRANRLLVIFPTDYQLEQFYNDGPQEFGDAATQGPLQVIDVRFSGVNAIAEHRKNTHQIFAITIQALREARGMDNCLKLTETGQWMVCVDEYHHYGVDKAWTRPVFALPKVFFLAMSATPWRPNQDGAFGVPDISMSYVEAEKERSVKPLRGHAYNYRIDVVLEDGSEESYTTAEFAGLVGSDDPERIEKFKIERKMRWSPKYISPLVSVPIERMLHDRIATGYRLQALIGAMCVSHAEFVCEQIKSMFPHLAVDWVGTGENGRSPEVNKKILQKFCPPKEPDGKRGEAKFDVLVHVGMAGEGLDTILVSEVVFLSSASICNKKLQEAGRAARYLPGVDGNINFDASSEFAEKRYVGSAFMQAMDGDPPTLKDEPKEREPGDPNLLPEEPFIQIYHMELIDIDSGDPAVQRMARVATEANIDTVHCDTLLQDFTHPGWEAVKKLYRAHQVREAEQFNEKAIISQWRENVGNAVALLTGRVIHLRKKDGLAIDNRTAGQIKALINKRKKWRLGEVTNDVELLQRHYNWCKQLEKELINKGISEWLAL